MLPLHHHGPNVILLLSFPPPTYTVEMSKLSGVDKVYKYQNISTIVVVYCCTVCGTVFCFFPRLTEFSLHGTISSHVGKISLPPFGLRIWFRETGLAAPSLVSLLILYTNAESGAYSRYSSRIPRRRPYIFASNTHHRVSPEFIGSRNCVPIAFTAESPLAQGQ